MPPVLSRFAAVLLSLCAATQAHAATTQVAVAANFTAPAREIAAAFKRDTGHDAVLSFGPSGTIYTQIAHGAPCEVSDEKVMITVQLKDGVDFNPDDVYQWFMKQQKEGGMDPKWMPDYIRVVDKFSVTDTQKIMVRPFKREHFNIEKNPNMQIYFRRRGDNTYRRLTPEEFNQLRDIFKTNGRETILVS